MEVSNEYLLANSPVIYCHLVSIFYTCQLTYTTNELLLYTTDILVNISSKIDLTGRRKSMYLLDDVTDAANKRFLARNKLLELTNPQVTLKLKNVSIAFIQLLSQLLQQNQSKFWLLRAIDIWIKLALCPENQAIFLSITNDILTHMVELLCCNTIAIDPLTSDIDAIYRKRVPGYVGVNFYPDHCDIEIRDAILDFMISLSLLSNTLQLRLANFPNCIELLFMICDITKTKTRTDGIQKAYSLLQWFSLRHSSNEIRRKFLAIHVNMIASACSDDYIAGMFIMLVGFLYLSDIVVL